MGIDDTKSKARKGAINAIEELIDRESRNGLNSIDLENYESLFYDDEVEEYFKDKGYKISGKVIKWG